MEANYLQRLTGAFVALALVHALDLQAPGCVVDYGAMGEQPEVLEHHCGLAAAELGELLVVVPEHVLAVYPDFARGGLDEADEAANERGLAAARQAHYHERFAKPHVEADVLERNHASQFRLDVRL